MASLIVKTPLGELQGSEYITDRGEHIYCFQGVPYGQPAVGSLRFKDPVPVEAWEGVKSAERPPPPAATVFLMPDGATVISPGSSEDCLYLNIYIPRIPSDEKLPVFVYIHGGGFHYGCGNKNFYGPDYLVPKDIVLVTVNYRLGPLGFLSFENTDCSGNYGLKDQTLALKWIQRNISSFGGDADNVTLCGESAGGASVHYHTISPLSKGLFHKGVALSGSALNRWAYSRNSKKSAFILAKRLGYEGHDAKEALQTLRDAPLDDLLTKSVGIFQEVEGEWAGENILCFSFVPTAEPVGTPNAFLTKTPAQALQDGDFMDIPYFSGICDQECIFVLKSPDYKPNWNDDLEFQAMLPKELGLPLGSEKLQVASKKIRDFYFPNGSSQEGFIKCNSALMFNYGIFKVAEAHAKNPKKTTPDFLYRFNAYRTPSSIKSFFKLDHIKGCSHGEDTDFIFLVNFNPLVKTEPIVAGSIEDQVKENLIGLLTNFARTGRPSSDWPAAVPEEKFPYGVITAETQIKTGFGDDEIQFWDDIYAYLKN